MRLLATDCRTMGLPLPAGALDLGSSLLISVTALPAKERPPPTCASLQPAGSSVGAPPSHCSSSGGGQEGSVGSATSTSDGPASPRTCRPAIIVHHLRERQHTISTQVWRHDIIVDQQPGVRVHTKMSFPCMIPPINFIIPTVVSTLIVQQGQRPF